MTLQEDIKYILIKKRMTLTKLAELMNLNSDRKYSVNTLSRRLSTDNLKFDEYKLLFEILGYEVIIQEKNENKKKKERKPKLKTKLPKKKVD